MTQMTLLITVASVLCHAYQKFLIQCSILNERLQQYFDKYNIIRKAQIGFQPKTKTSDQMFVLRTLIEKYISKGSKLFACFVDFA